MTFATNYLGLFIMIKSTGCLLRVNLNYLFICLFLFLLFPGHFLLTKLLLKKMIETAKVSGIQGRVVNVSSTVHGWFAGDLLKYLGEISRAKR